MAGRNRPTLQRKPASANRKKFTGSEEDFLSHVEGGRQLQGYWPESPDSGATIATGVDLSGWTRKKLEEFGVPATILDKIPPEAYTTTGSKAKAIAESIRLDDKEARLLENSVSKPIFDEAKTFYNSKNPQVKWDDLNPRQRGVLKSIAYNLRGGLRKAPSVTGKAAKGDWEGVASELRDPKAWKEKGNKGLRNRRVQEAEFLEGYLKNPKEQYGPAEPYGPQRPPEESGPPVPEPSPESERDAVIAKLRASQTDPGAEARSAALKRLFTKESDTTMPEAKKLKVGESMPAEEYFGLPVAQPESPESAMAPPREELMQESDTIQIPSLEQLLGKAPAQPPAATEQPPMELVGGPAAQTAQYAPTEASNSPVEGQIDLTGLQPLTQEEIASYGLNEEIPMDALQGMDLTPVEQAPPKTGGAGQSALEGFGQTASMGYLPEMQAAMKAGIQDPLASLITTGQLDPEDYSDRYQRELEANRARQAQQAEEHPIATGAGKAGGFVSSMLAPTGAARMASKVPQLASMVQKAAGIGQALPQGAKTAAAWTVGSRPVKGALQGAAMGGAYGTGEDIGSEADLAARGETAKFGAKVGAGMGALGSLVAGGRQLGGFIGQKLSGMRGPEARMYQEAPGEVGKIASNLKAGNASEVVDEALTVGRNALKKVDDGVKKAANAVDDAVKGKKVEVDPRQFLGKDYRATKFISKYLPKKTTTTTKPSSKVFGKTEKVTTSTRPVPKTVKVDASELNKFKRTMDQRANWKRSRVYTEDEIARKGMSRDMANYSRKKISDAVPETKPHNTKMRKAYKLKDDVEPQLERSPDSLFRREDVDTVAKLQKLEKLGGEGLERYSRLRTAAESMNPKGGDALSFTGSVLRPVGRTTLRAEKALQTTQEGIGPALTRAGGGGRGEKRRKK